MSPTEKPVRKRARTAIAATSDSLSSFDVNARANELSDKISSLCKEFPEINYIIDSQKLQAIVIKTAVQKYKADLMKTFEMEEEKKGKGELVPLHSLPDEVLQICLSFLGKGYYGVVGLVSKKLHKFYKEVFGQETAYLEMATSVNLASHCLSNLCKCSNEKDELIRAAAVNGNVDILRDFFKDGYDLFPLIELKRGPYETADEEEEEEDDNSVSPFVGIYYTDEDEMSTCSTYMRENKVKLSRLVARGHLHILKYLYKELHYKIGMERYVLPAIKHNQLEILKWLKDIGAMNEYHEIHAEYYNSDRFNFCDHAVKSGSVKVLKWLLDQEYNFFADDYVMEYAIESNSIDMIQFCSDKGYSVEKSEHRTDIIVTRNVDVYRLLHKLGFAFEGEINTWVSCWHDITDYFDILKFLRSISVPWDDKIMAFIVAYGSLEMIQYAVEDGCCWSSDKKEYSKLLCWQPKKEAGIFSGGRMLVKIDDNDFEKLQFLIDNDCSFNYDYPCDMTKMCLMEVLRKKKELSMLEYFVGKNSAFDKKILWYFLKHSSRDDFWSEGISCILETGKDIETFKSIEEALNKYSYTMEFIQCFHSQGLPWCVDPSRNTHLLSKIACHNDLDDVKWAYENGCRGSQSFPYIKEEWEKNGIRHLMPWKANCHFFEENDMLPHMNLLENAREDYGQFRQDLAGIDNSDLKSLVDGDFIFRSEWEKESHVIQALEKCFEHSYGGYGENFNNRKRLTLFLQMKAVPHEESSEGSLNGSSECLLDDSSSSSSESSVGSN